jgi:hypothetical protein
MLRGTLPDVTPQTSGRRWTRITEANAAAFLMDDRNRAFLPPFLGRESSVAAAAEEAGVGLDDLYYRVRRMTALGILQVTREEPRAGRPIKLYRMPGDGLFIPFATTPAASLEELLVRSNAAFDARLVRAQVDAMWAMIDDPDRWGFRIFYDAGGSMHFDYAPEDAPDDFDLHRFWLAPQLPALVAGWYEMPLAAGDAKALQRELVELVARYSRLATRGDDTGTTHMLRVALVPLPRA